MTWLSIWRRCRPEYKARWSTAFLVCIDDGVPGSPDQTVALRIVVLADRLYTTTTTTTPTRSPSPATARWIFTEEMINGGYRKKPLRATSSGGSVASPNPKV